MPNTASGVQLLLGATNAAAMDINTACTSFLYGLSSATAMIRTGVVRNAVVIGVEGSRLHGLVEPQRRRLVRRRRGGCRAAGERRTRRRAAEKLGCYADARHTLRVRGMGTIYGNNGLQLGDTRWDSMVRRFSNALCRA